MINESEQAILKMLETHHTMTLATCLNNQPWAASVFYVSDEKFNLYFVSDVKTRHGQHLANNPWAAAAIQSDCVNWSEIRGLQLEGQVTILNSNLREKILTYYFAKFPQIQTLFEQPQNDGEKLIADRLLVTNFYCLTPNYIKLIDNRCHFGYKVEWLNSNI